MKNAKCTHTRLKNLIKSGKGLTLQVAAAITDADMAELVGHPFQQQGRRCAILAANW
jgi:hypothetical protein